MFIPFHYQYKNYPSVPKATGKSAVLGVMTSFVAMCLWSLLVMGIVGYILSRCGMSEGLSYGIGVVFMILFIYGVLKGKKRMEQKIEEEAAAETLKMLSMTEEEKASAIEQQKKQIRKILLYFVGGLFLIVFVILLANRI